MVVQTGQGGTMEIEMEGAWDIMGLELTTLAAHPVAWREVNNVNNGALSCQAQWKEQDWGSWVS